MKYVQLRIGPSADAGLSYRKPGRSPRRSRRLATSEWRECRKSEKTERTGGDKSLDITDNQGVLNPAKNLCRTHGHTELAEELETRFDRGDNDEL